MRTTLFQTLLCFMLVSVLLFGVAMLFIYQQYDQYVYLQEEEYAAQVLQTTASHLREEMDDVADDMYRLASEQVFMDFGSMSVTERFQVRDYVKTILESFASFKKSVISIKLHLPEHSGIYSSQDGATVRQISLFLAYRQMIEEYHLDQDPAGFFITRTYTFDGRNLFGIAVPVYSSMVMQSGSNYIGCLLAICDYQYLQDALPVDSVPCMVTDGERMLLHNGAPDFSMQAFLAQDGLMDIAIPGANLKAYALYSDAAVEAQMTFLRGICLRFLVLLLMVQCMLMVSLRLKILKPIQNIAKQTQQIGYGMMRLKNPDASRNELVNLTNCINDMLLRVEQLNRDAANAETRYLKERVMFLQTQINPHFLFNNLECVRGMASLNRCSSIISIVSSMAKMYRYCVDSRSIVALEEELNCVKEYMQIMTLRYEGAFTLETDVEDDALILCIPKMVLQPLMENAIQHGFLHARRRQGRMWICAKAEDDWLEVSVSDDGAGMSEEQLEVYNTNSAPVVQDGRQHIGIRNILSRIEVICHPDSCVTFQNREEGGCRIILRIKPDHAFSGK